MKHLVIVESAAKAKTIQKYLGSLSDIGSFVVIASLGHIVDLPKKELGIDKRTWIAKYQTLPGKHALVQKIQKLAANSHTVYIASDPDMEGEAIARHLADCIPSHPRVRRITFHEITKQAIINAVRSPRDIDESMVHAQEARRMLDRVIGYELSPVLWNHFSVSSLSAGRVQSVALKILVDRASECKSFTPSICWKIQGSFNVDGQILVATMDDKIHQETDIRKTLQNLVHHTTTWKAHCQEGMCERKPPPPYVTASLQQDAHTRFGWTSKYTMKLAQDLYEQGAITYMRTDSPRIAHQAQHAILDFITVTFDKDHSKPRQYTSRAANAQNAHECIRPTRVETRMDTATSHGRLYDMIWRRTIASQMISATYTTLQITVSNDIYTFRGSTERIKHRGFLKIMKEDDQIPTTHVAISPWKGCIPAHALRFSCDPHTTEHAPALYNEGSLIHCLETHGVGRPSTYAAIIDKLIQRGYVETGRNPYTITKDTYEYAIDTTNREVQKQRTTLTIGNTTASNLFIPTALGQHVVDFLDEHFTNLLNISFTATMETLLDKIAEKTVTKEHVLTDFYTAFEQLLKQAKRTEKQDVATLQQDGTMQIKHTKYGVALYDTLTKKYISLSAYMQWRKIRSNAISSEDFTFLKRLPLRFDNTTREVHLGRYGLYIKDGNKNYPLQKTLWKKAYDGTLTGYEITTCHTA